MRRSPQRTGLHNCESISRTHPHTRIASARFLMDIADTCVCVCVCCTGGKWQHHDVIYAQTKPVRARAHLHIVTDHRVPPTPADVCSTYKWAYPSQPHAIHTRTHTYTHISHTRIFRVYIDISRLHDFLNFEHLHTSLHIFAHALQRCKRCHTDGGRRTGWHRHFRHHYIRLWFVTNPNYTGLCKVKWCAELLTNPTADTGFSTHAQAATRDAFDGEWMGRTENKLALSEPN